MSICGNKKIMLIHPAAVIDPSAELADHVSVGPGAVIFANVKIGNGTQIGPNAVIHPYTTMGKDCRVHAGAVIGDVPQDLGFKNVPSFVRIGDRVTMREGVTIHRGTKENTSTVAGDDCYLMANSHLAHNVTLGKKVIIVNGALLAGYVEVGDGAFVSGNVTIHQFCKVGRLAMVGGLSGINKDVLPFCATESSKRCTISGLNIIGLKRAGFTPEQRKTIKQCFSIVYREGLNTTQALEKLKQQDSNPIVQEFCDFIEKSDRGLCGFSMSSE